MTLAAMLCVCLVGGLFPASGSSCAWQTGSSAQTQSAQPSTPAIHPASKDAPTRTNATKKAAAARPKVQKLRQDCSKSSSQPCPPSKVVVKNGGSVEPTVELKGSSSQQQQRSETEQVNAGTEDNLREIAGKVVDPSRQETINQAKEFIAQSKAAIAQGDLDRGHSLAMKARLLSDELVKQ